MIEPAATASRPRDSLRWAWRLVSVRLRFPLVIGLALLVVAQWDLLRNHWDRWTRPAGDPSGQAVSADTEYFCPMDPGVVADWPGKCGVCNMALVRRKRGDMAPLPEGVVARMQFTPYRLHLAGIRSTPVGYQPLAREVEAPALVIAVGPGKATAEAEVFEKDIEFLKEGQAAAVSGDRVETLKATVGAIRPDVRLRIDDPMGSLRVGMTLRARIDAPIAGAEPFRSLPHEPPALKAGEGRRVYTCMEHPEIVRTAAGRCPNDNRALARRDLAANQRLRFGCPMHPAIVAETPGSKCDACGGMGLVPRVVSYAPPGEVLAVPESAVVDTGLRRVVYVERMSDTFDGVEVTLGPRCGDHYPVLRGLEPGDRVVTAGAFLVDAETRLNPGLAAGYFGAARKPAESETTAEDESLPPADRALVDRQKTCPVTGKPLGSMGTPTRHVVSGRVVFLCCDGSEPKLMADPAK
jgi:hypothetical protein